MVEIFYRRGFEIFTFISKEDLITSIFDLIFLLTQIWIIRILLKDKVVKGFDPKSMILFIGWNIWSLLYIYPAANLFIASIITGILILSQLVWFLLAVTLNKKTINPV